MIKPKTKTDRYGNEILYARVLIRREKTTGKEKKKLFKIPFSEDLKKMGEERRVKVFNQRLSEFLDDCKTNEINKHYQLSEYIQEYITRMEETDNNEQNTLTGYKNYAKHISEKIGYMYIDEIKPGMFDKFFYELAQPGNNKRHKTAGLSKQTIKKIKTFLHLIYRDAKINGAYIGENPIELTKEIKTIEKEKTIFTDEELRQIITGCEKLSPKVKMFFYIAIFTACRRGEIMGLKWEDINYKDKTIHVCRNIKYIDNKITAGTTKTKNSVRTISVCDELLGALKEYQTYTFETTGLIPNGYIINRDNSPEPTCPDTASSWSRQLEKITGLEINAHKFRHTTISIWFKKGIDAKTISVWAGHSQLTTTLNIYTHTVEIANDERRNVLQDIIKGA